MTRSVKCCDNILEWLLQRFKGVHTGSHLYITDPGMQKQIRNTHELCMDCYIPQWGRGNQVSYIDQYHGAPICMLVSGLRTRPSHGEEK